MIFYFFRFLLLLLLLFKFSLSFAYLIPLGSSSAEVEIRRVESYFNNILGFRSDFHQLGSDGVESSGKFYYGSGGRMRFEYSPPAPYLLISTGRRFIYVDRDLDEVTRASLSDVPLGFLLSGDVLLRGSEHRVDRIEFGDDMFIIRLELFVGDVSFVDLLFDTAPFRLSGWVLEMGGGDRTFVSLRNIEEGISLDRSLFRYFREAPDR